LGDLPAPFRGDLPAPQPASTPAPSGTPRRSKHKGSSRRALLIVELIAVGAVVAAAVMAMFWSSALSERDDANAARDLAVLERDAAIDVAEQAVADQATTQVELDAATAEIGRLQGEIDANVADLDALNTEVDGLTVHVTDLTTANVELATSIEDLEARLAIPPAPVSFDPTTQPEFARYVGEVLSARNGASRLSLEQRQCFGGLVLSTVGLDGFGAGFHDGATTEANNALVGAMQFAAAGCGIDQTLIFD
jgi:hypothetical protein